MMEKKLELIVALRDKVAGNFGNPLVIDNEATAIRMFSDLIQNKDTVVGKHPIDFDLCRLGYFDRLTGEIFAKFDVDTDIIIRGIEAEAIAGGSNE